MKEIYVNQFAIAFLGLLFCIEIQVGTCLAIAIAGGLTIKQIVQYAMIITWMHSEAAQQAVNQINQNKYYEELKSRAIHQFIKVGISLCGKQLHAAHP